MKESTLETADAIFVLGGSVYDRPVAAKHLFDEGWSKKIITLGENFSSSQLAWYGGDESKCIPDALMMRTFLESLGVPTQNIVPIVKGTSTKEESDAILKFALKNNYETIIILSDYFHLRRINGVFTDKFSQEGIKVILTGAKSSSYNEEFWWQYEQGLIMVNNEYIKLFYYWMKGY